jgi:hypothetical protein
MATEVKFGDWISKGFDLYKENLATLIVATLIAVVLSAVTAGILAGPMMAGLILIVLDLVDRKGKPDVSRLFNGFQHFAQSFLYVLVWGLIIILGSTLLNFILCVGTLAAIAGSLALSTLLMFGMFLIVDRGMAFWPASMQSLQTVKAQFFPLLGFFIVAAAIGQIGFILCGVGAVLTMPIAYCMLAVAYREYFPAQGSAPAPGAPQA